MALRYTVHLEDDQGRAHVFGPGDVVPAWARAKITNPLAWDDDDSATQAAAVHNRVELAWGDESADSDSDEADGPPPQSGPGASRRLWAEYAQAHDVVVEAAWKRDDIIAACQRAGIAV